MIRKITASLVCASLYLASPLTAGERDPSSEDIKVEAQELKESTVQHTQDLASQSANLTKDIGAYLLNKGSKAYNQAKDQLFAPSEQFRIHLASLREAVKVGSPQHNEKIYANAVQREANVSSYLIGPQWLVGLVNNNNIDYLQLQDGSCWYINPSDYYKLEYWVYGDVLELSLNNGVLANEDFAYYLSNPRRGSTIEVNFAGAPVQESPYALHIHEFDHETGKLSLNDESYWQIPVESLSLVTQWAEGDSIILAKEQLLFGWRPVLINVDQNQRVIAQKFVLN